MLVQRNQATPISASTARSLIALVQHHLSDTPNKNLRAHCALSLLMEKKSVKHRLVLKLNWCLIELRSIQRQAGSSLMAVSSLSPMERASRSMMFKVQYLVSTFTVVVSLKGRSKWIRTSSLELIMNEEWLFPELIQRHIWCTRPLERLWGRAQHRRVPRTLLDASDSISRQLAQYLSQFSMMLNPASTHSCLKILRLLHRRCHNLKRKLLVRWRSLERSMVIEYELSL